MNVKTEKVEIYFPKCIVPYEINSGIKDYHLFYEGYVEYSFSGEDRFAKCEIIWDKLNWACWTKEKPDYVYTEISYCDYGVVLKFENNPMYYLALSMDWLVGDKETIEQYILEHQDKIIWLK